jgi:DNA-binding NarL/FixJ family response regulator
MIVPVLTQREHDVLAGLNRGLTPTAIAVELGIRLETCRGYVKALHAKLGAHSQLEALVRAQRLGLVDAADE